MSQDQEVMTVGSPDSGVGDALTVSIDKLLLDDNQNESEKGKVIEDDDDAGKQDNGKRVVIVDFHPHQYRGTSVSSDETGTSVGEERELSSSPKTREERISLLKDLLETYFSDNYLTRDIFLLKHFRKSKEGWISLKFMASYKKIKRTAKSREEVDEAVRMSSLLEMNQEGNKVRRLAPFPACIDEYIPTRMTIIGALPKDMRNLAVLSNFLSSYGEVASLQVLRPGINVPENLMSTAINFPQLKDQWCAVVEFDEIQSAGKLASDINEGKTDSGLTWAKELVMPWKNRKNSERQQDKSPNWTENVRNKCRSCPSSGYSSPCMTPEQSPLCGHIHNECRGLSRRERIMMSRACQNICCQHVHFQATCSPNSRKTYNRTNRQSDDGAGYRSPKRPSSYMTAETCNNWRTASSN